MSTGIAAGRALMVVALLAACLPAQEPRAALLGIVTGPSGAVVAGAKVTAINAETAVRRSTESNRDGNYVIPYLAPGAYRLRVECTGFKTHEQGPIELRINDRLRVDVTLRTGDAGAAQETEPARCAGSRYGAAHDTVTNSPGPGPGYALEDNR